MLAIGWCALNMVFGGFFIDFGSFPFAWMAQVRSRPVCSIRFSDTSPRGFKSQLHVPTNRSSSPPLGPSARLANCRPQEKHDRLQSPRACPRARPSRLACVPPCRAAHPRAPAAPRQRDVLQPGGHRRRGVQGQVRRGAAPSWLRHAHPGSIIAELRQACWRARPCYCVTPLVPVYWAPRAMPCAACWRASR
jgi:hypothetical protein